MTLKNHHKRQHGAALIIGMILLAIITLLAVVGMNISNSELAAANSEQLRTRAFNASESGIESGTGEMMEIETSTVNQTTDVVGAAVAIEGAPDTDTFELRSRYRGDSQLTDTFGKGYTSFHFSTISRGTSARNTVVDHVQGAYMINSTGGQDTFTALPADAIPVATP